ncbi:hypothetical protein BX283_1751 [Streptomyces sp. TLI_146]|nr:hypothetical protein BX283_1751 [Streptomyces sp. TLI_146]
MTYDPNYPLCIAGDHATGHQPRKEPEPEPPIPIRAKTACLLLLLLALALSGGLAR